MTAGLKAASKGPSVEALKKDGPSRSRMVVPSNWLNMKLPSELGSQTVQCVLRTGALRTKLAIGQADDPLESEVDDIAERIISI